MKTLNFDSFEMFVLTNDEMYVVRGGDGDALEGDPTPIPPTPPIKI